MNTSLRILLAVPILIAGISAAGPKLSFDDGKKSLEIMQAYQIWGVATLDPKSVPVPDPRADLYFRRARLGLKGQAYPKLDYLVWFAYDNLGKDPNTGTLGTPQIVPNTTFQVWDAYMTYHLDSTWANVSLGLFRPQVGSEFISSFTAVPSLEKALTHYYVRDHLLTRPSGRETGINAGGFLADSVKKWAVGYNFGIFDANQEKTTAVAAGSLKWSPLLTGRVSATVGDPENKEYKLSTDLNSFGKRTGLTLSAYATWQGESDEKLDTTQANPYIGGFKRNSVYGSSLLLNWRYLELDGEFDFLYREFTDAFPALYAATKKNAAYVPFTSFQDKVWHIRAGYSIPIPAGQFLEPSLLYSAFIGDKSSPINTDGTDNVLDGGLNWYIQKNSLKVSLHYVVQDGEAKSQFTQGPDKKGALKQRNDYLALGVLIGI
ncbi:MAG: phosphate-selective porin and superfamily protein [Fibrobacteres bacterium]|nr:phosphate-selective porin and superfamily protein [Fibrobacterota bacterium]